MIGVLPALAREKIAFRFDLRSNFVSETLRPGAVVVDWLVCVFFFKQKVSQTNICV